MKASPTLRRAADEPADRDRSGGGGDPRAPPCEPCPLGCETRSPGDVRDLGVAHRVRPRRPSSRLAVDAEQPSRVGGVARPDPDLAAVGVHAPRPLCLVERMSTRIGSSVSFRTWCAPPAPPGSTRRHRAGARAPPPDRGGWDGRRSRGATPRCRTRSGTGRSARRLELVDARAELLGADPLADRCASPREPGPVAAQVEVAVEDVVRIHDVGGPSRTPAAASASASAPASPCRPLRPRASGADRPRRRRPSSRARRFRAASRPAATPFAPNRSARTPTRITISQIPRPNGIAADATRVADRAAPCAFPRMRHSQRAGAVSP